ncbi:prokineticin Bm8-f-like [Branchiostoma lanceolatum]|uniref:PROK1 protein n=1 Tax=Branchiostoma lanceolatum TaxID=7740 RepID=A0A8J9ZDU9_BRALA|nr:PROK1 [Branchiostoma lanceolatum]
MMVDQAWRAAAATILLTQLVLQGSGAIVMTGVCQNDVECMAGRGEGSCCASFVKSGILSGIPICKPPAGEGDDCHLILEAFVPYPHDSPRYYWQCPCGPGLTCLPVKRGDVIGKCWRPRRG